MMGLSGDDQDFIGSKLQKRDVIMRCVLHVARR